MDFLEKIFIQLFEKYAQYPYLSNQFFAEIHSFYSTPSRHYHTMQHLAQMHRELAAYGFQGKEADACWLALFYHDSVYKPLATDNEEQSAALATHRLTEAGFPAAMVSLCSEAILATKTHEKHPLELVNAFLDADMAILGQTQNIYMEYANSVRREYAIFPDFMYKKGRKKVLESFLNRDSIYYTSFFYNL